MELTVESTGGDSHRITVRGHSFLVDQPLSDGGGDAGPTPVELFVASLAACVGHYARRALGAQSSGARVHCTWTMSDAPPWRVTGVDIRVEVPEETAPARVAAVQRAVGHCTVHNTLVDLPVIRIEVPLAHGFDRAVA
ncbi:MAG TPA: OsmC family protein [Candidatus Angelobacter sp.]|jgi:putative redox protein|nr:OsmC family protein [Candidatus Angelobacter sp.]